MLVGRSLAVAAIVVGLIVAGCGSGSTTYRVAPGTYSALVPSLQQFDLDAAAAIPGGFAPLRLQGVSSVEVRIEGNSLSFTTDDGGTATLAVAERRAVTDREGSGPFKATKEVLLLSDDLSIGGLVIPTPAVWPGSFEGSPIITVKVHDPAERGPDISCGPTERCLLLSSGVDPAGNYERITPPGGREDSLASIRITQELLELTLDDGRKISRLANTRSSTLACALAESPVWEIPVELGLPMVDPVLVHTVCPTNPGTSIQLVIMERAAIPALAPLAPNSDGEWCDNGPTCIWFAPT
ncbi:MAG: hypothetical protein AB7T37_07330 [Dehalococcoidia bacterium]